MLSALSPMQVNRSDNKQHGIIKPRAEVFYLLCAAVNLLRAKLSAPNRLINGRNYQCKVVSLKQLTS